MGVSLILISLFAFFWQRRSEKAACVAREAAQQDQREGERRAAEAQLLIHDYSVAVATHTHLNALYYQRQLHALSRVLAAHGLRFTRQVASGRSTRFTLLPYEIQREVVERVSRERYTHLYPYADEPDIARRVLTSMSDGYGMRLLEDMVESLVEQGFGLELSVPKADGLAPSIAAGAQVWPDASSLENRLEDAVADMLLRVCRVAEDDAEAIAKEYQLCASLFGVDQTALKEGVAAFDYLDLGMRRGTDASLEEAIRA